MIQDLHVSMVLGAVPVRRERAAGVVAELAGVVRRSPWLIFEGAVATFTFEGLERSFPISPHLWARILDRAMGELPDPGAAENLCELLWSEGIDAEPEIALSGGGLFLDPRARVRVHIADFACEAGLDLARGRDAWLVGEAFHQVLAEAATAFPPTIATEDDGDAEIARRAYAGQPQRVVASCTDCGAREHFSGHAPVVDRLHDFARREMARRHQLCGVRRRLAAAPVPYDRVRLSFGGTQIPLDRVTFNRSARP
jgi:hypothetical protein